MTFIFNLLMKKFMEPVNLITSLGGRSPIYITRLTRYGVAGGLTLVLDIVLLFILVEFLGIYYLLAAGTTYVIAHSTNYFIQRNWGFKESKSHVFKGYVYFIFFGILGIFLTVSLLAVAVEKLELNYLLGRWFVSIFVGLVLFVLNYNITFKMGKELSHLFKRVKKKK